MERAKTIENKYFVEGAPMYFTFSDSFTGFCLYVEKTSAKTGEKYGDFQGHWGTFGSLLNAMVPRLIELGTVSTRGRKKGEEFLFDVEKTVEYVQNLKDKIMKGDNECLKTYLIGSSAQMESLRKWNLSKDQVKSTSTSPTNSKLPRA